MRWMISKLTSAISPGSESFRANEAANLAALELVREGLGVTLINPFPLLSSGVKDVVVRPFDAAIQYHTSFVLPSGRPPSHLARQFMRFVKLTTPQDHYSEPV